MEMLVVMAVMAIITTVVLVEYRGSEKKILLRLTAQEMVSNLREAQNMSFSGQQFEGEIPEGGYGGHFINTSPGSYIIFADYNEDGNYDEDGYYIEEDYFEEEIKTIDLPNGIEIYSLETISVSRNWVDIVFISPSGEAVIADNDMEEDDPDRDTAEIGLQIEGTSISEEISITALGVGTIEY